MRFRIMVCLLAAIVCLQVFNGAYAQNNDFKALLGKDFSTCLNPTDPKYDAKACEKLSKSSNDLLNGLLGGKNSLLQSAKDCTPGVEHSVLVKGCTAVISNPFMIPKGKAEASYIRGGAYLAVKKYELALKDADASLSYGGFPGEAHFLKAATLLAMSQYSQSIKHFSEAISMPPKSVTLDLIYRSRGVAKRKAGFIQEALADFDEALKRNPGDVESYLNRGWAYSSLFQYDKALADFKRALRIRPKSPEVLIAKADVYAAMYQFKRAISDYKYVSNGKFNRPDAEYLKALSHVGRGMAYATEGVSWQALQNADIALKKVKGFAPAYLVKSLAYTQQRKFRKAIAFANKAIANKKFAASGYRHRGYAYLKSGKTDRAIADFTTAIEKQPNLLWPYVFRGQAYLQKEQFQKALTDINKSISLNSREPYGHMLKGILLEAQGKKQAAFESYNKGVNSNSWDSHIHGEIRKEALAGYERLKRFSNISHVSNIKAKKKAVKLALAYGRRVALVIGNGKYENASRLVNTHNDAKAIAAKLRALGFAEVIELYDLNYGKLRKVLKRFGDLSTSADWAVIYYAGHGIQVDGKNYIIPTDAVLERASHIEDEAVSLNRVLSKVEDAKKLRMVILDACRNNPFASRMFRRSGSRTRSLGKGLAPIEPDRGTLVAYSARDGQVAFDGDGQNSPYTRALLLHLDEEGLEINLLFRKVRDTVLGNTGRQQEPYVYGSLPGIELYFKH